MTPSVEAGAGQGRGQQRRQQRGRDLVADIGQEARPTDPGDPGVSHSGRLRRPISGSATTRRHSRTELQIDRPGKATRLLGQERYAGLFAVAGAVGASRAEDAERKCAGGRGISVPRKSRERPVCDADQPVSARSAQYR